MSNIKFKHNLYVRWTFKLVSKTFHIHLHEETDVKFLGCIDNQIFFAMKLRHVDRALTCVAKNASMEINRKDYVWHNPKEIGVACTYTA